MEMLVPGLMEVAALDEAGEVEILEDLTGSLCIFPSKNFQKHEKLIFAHDIQQKTRSLFM